MTVHEPRLGFHAHITPGEWTEYVKPRDAKGGSFNRLLPVIVQGSKVLPYGHKERYPEIAGLSDAYDWARKTPRRMTLSKDAARKYDELRAAFLDKMLELPADLRCYVERTPEQIIRVAAVLTASEMRTTITRAAITAAWAFVQYSMRSTEKLVRGDDSSSRGRTTKPLPELIREILRDEGGEASSSRMLRRLGVRATATSLRAAVESMEDVETVRGKSETGRGRPPMIYRLIGDEAVDSATETVDGTVKQTVPARASIPVQRSTSAADFVLPADWL
jgi:hypothetical protein